jgi:hypothetical protein
VWIFKQWHLSPGVDTKTSAPTGLPQEKNQVAIYRQLEKWISEARLSNLVAEGCSGAMAEGFAAKFNGWTLAELKKRAQDAEYVQILAPIPMKLEAKFGEKLNTVCGDDEKLIQAQSLALSNLRGLMGYLTRIEEFKAKPERAKAYLDGAREVLKLKAGASIEEVTKSLKAELKSEFAKIQSITASRNEKFAQTAIAVRGKGVDIAIVVGGLHADGIRKILGEKGLGCRVIEPSGYRPDDEEMVTKKLPALIDAL